MDTLFNNVCAKCSEITTKRYSTSFSIGILLFDKSIRNSIYSIYGFVRFADEIVDTYDGQDKAKILDEFSKDVYTAIERKVSFNPILHAFQDVVNKYDIDHKLICAFLHSMTMDIDNTVYCQDSYNTYIYGSAEVVGLMCLYVFTNGDKKLFEKLKPYASALGSAFQKVNFLRDMQSDFIDRGRVYFPKVDFKNFTQLDKQIIEADIKAEFDYAYIGIKQLPTNCRLGVYTAYRYYLKLFELIKHQTSSQLLSGRISVPNSQKIFLLAKSSMRNLVGAL
jgi:15-cis-phytoene synthase